MGWEDTLVEETTTHSIVLAGRIPWTEEPGGIQSMRSQRLRHGGASHCIFIKAQEACERQEERAESQGQPEAGVQCLRVSPVYSGVFTPTRGRPDPQEYTRTSSSLSGHHLFPDSPFEVVFFCFFVFFLPAIWPLIINLRIP